LNASGITLIEVLVVVTIIGLGVGAAAFYLAPLETPLHTGTVLLEGFFRQVRRQAMATTSAYRVVPVGSERVIAQRASSCLATTWVEDPKVNLRLPDGVDMSDSTWNVCFSSRGISTNNVTVTLTHADLGQKQVEVLIGGTTRVIQ
jgi:prepilin-type N-terminal cleavage/methylation domain-containing protein